MIGDTVSESVVIAATPHAAFTVVSDLAQMGRFSLENRGGRWVGSVAGPALGARFKGFNRQGRASWSTIATVSRFEPDDSFTFDVTYFGIPVSQWSYVIDAEGDGIRLTQTWCDNRPAWFAFVTKPLIADRTSFTRDSVHHTLTTMKAFLEA